jgi:hypothetical protein
MIKEAPGIGPKTMEAIRPEGTRPAPPGREHPAYWRISDLDGSHANYDVVDGLALP